MIGELLERTDTREKRIGDGALGQQLEKLDRAQPRR